MKLSAVLIKWLVVSWAILCIAVFMGNPGSISYVHWSSLRNLSSLGARIENIDLTVYVTNLLFALIGVFLFCTACVFLGSALLRALCVQDMQQGANVFSRLALLGTVFLLGHGAFALIFLALAGTFRLRPEYTAAIFISGTLLGASSLQIWFFPPYQAHAISCHETKNTTTNRVLLLLTFGILISSLMYTSARQSYDATAIYFSDAKISALTSRAEYFTDDTFVVSVLQSTIQYTANIQLFGDQAARAISWVSGLIIIFFSIALAERVGLSRTARLLLVLFVLSSTAYLDLMGDGKVDLISSAPAIAAVYWMVVDEQTNQTSKSTLLLIGLFAGLAIAARPFNAFLLGLFVLLFYIRRAFLQRSHALMFTSLGWIGIGVFALGMIHLLANWVILGDPLAFLSSVSGINPSAGPWDSDPERVMLFRLLYPIAVTLVNTPQSLGNITPLFLAFSPAILIADVRKRLLITEEFKALLLISISILLLWILLFFTVLEIRYVMFLWIILFMPLAEITAAALGSTDRLFSRISSGLIIVFLLYIMFRTIFISIDTYSPLDREGNPQCYQSRFCEYLRPINQVALPGDRVLTLSAFRYYLRTDLFACSTRHEEYQQLQAASSRGSVDFWLEVYRQGYKYIAYENDYTVRHLKLPIIPDPGNTPAWMKLEPISGQPGDLEIAYQIHFLAPPGQIEKTCKTTMDGIWGVGPTSP